MLFRRNRKPKPPRARRRLLLEELGGAFRVVYQVPRWRYFWRDDGPPEFFPTFQEVLLVFSERWLHMARGSGARGRKERRRSAQKILQKIVG